MLAARLKNAAERSDFVNNFSYLSQVVRDFARDVTLFDIAPRHMHGLAFCYLVNSGAHNSHVLKGFQAVEDAVLQRGRDDSGTPTA